jgi:hypothetical protein
VLSERQGLEPFSKFMVSSGSGTLFTNLGSKEPALEPCLKFRVPRNWFWNPFSNLRFRLEAVPETLPNIGFLSVSEPVPRTGSGTH